MLKKNVYFLKIPVQSFIPEIENEMPRDIRQDGQISGQKEYWKQLRSLEKKMLIKWALLGFEDIEYMNDIMKE